MGVGGCRISVSNKETRYKDMIKCIDYGKSRYEGWYCAFIENGMCDGLYAKTYKELLRRCKLSGITLNGAMRKDNL